MDINLSTDYINNALEFYEIADLSYKEKCIDCIKKIKDNRLIYNKFYEIYTILYSDSIDKISELWNYHNIRDLFGENYYEFTTNILLLIGFEKHKNNMKKIGFDERQISIHKKRVKECLINDIFNRNYDNIRISQMLWGVYFVNVKLIEIGRLQYEYCKDYIKIHIPGGDKLDFDKAIKSIKDSKDYIEKYYNSVDLDYYCESWLLSKQIKMVLNSDNNIIKFQSLFEIKKGLICTRDILKFVFNTIECNDYNLLPENTTLQKNIKRYLINNFDIKLGIGKVKSEFICNLNNDYS